MPRPWQDSKKHEFVQGGQLEYTIKPKQFIFFLHTRVHLVQFAWHGHWATFLVCLADLSRFYGRGKTGPNADFCKIRPPKNSLFGPAKPGKHVVEPDLAQPVPYTLGKSWFTCPSGYANQAFWFTQSSCSLHSICFLCLHIVYTQFTRPIQACKPRANYE